jgi:preprotein translocase subunit SecE
MEANGAIARVVNWPRRVRDYYNELRNEMKRVTWPNRKQVRATTGVVLFTVFMFAIYFFVVDAVLARTVTQVYQTFTR